ncbi:MAG: polysaccharide biosynthesis tyrosine autokinase [Halomonas sp.]|jgi:tyrosine-protein kinase Etk/Wzc|uniref:Polysaccharide biosynthesis tyrosine autokinase n=1 Tax=Billgrantia tianxiuensis TaxID=2497861 RepID=A0A6I6SCV6_9GAMM|nr:MULTISPECIES: polysaccharide biosynthesis tyrosine autokinase [Halomonas]MCE8035049.1 polysaccharide biosynthesis tyrosine autokinase [Halomonas sp. MCCC 1A11057]MDX5434712.1 polysaccharide biosynthesis tyrosine autokinase [Halomonas sp.]QHC48448.1 polysaccharide biosynthesis tyrosine autokinase [Halomonas tianxiuensis]
MTIFSNPPGSPPAPSESSDISLRKLVDALNGRKFLLLGSILAFMLAGYFYSSSQPRIYQSDALIQVENRAAILSLLDSLAGGEQLGNPTAAELEILQSRMVMGETVDRLDLTLNIEPRRMPWVGDFLVNHGVQYAWLERLVPEFLLQRLPGAKASLGSPYVWAGETLRLSRFETPVENEGWQHTLRVTGEDTYELWLDETLLLSGRAGETVSNEQGYRIFVSQLDAHAGAEFHVRRMSRLSAIGQLQRRFMIMPRGKDSGVYQVFLNGPDRILTQQTLDTITGVFLTQNVQRQSEEAEKQLAFLDEQIPQVNELLTEAENQLNSYRSQRDSVDLTFETQNLLTRLVAVENQLTELALAEADLAERFRPTHPNYQALLRQRSQLQAERERINALVGELPETQQEVLRLTRDTQVNQQVYVQLLNQRQEMRLLKAGTVGNVRILDNAEMQPGIISPRVPLTTLISGLIGALLAALGVILRLLLSQAVKSPDQLEEIGLPVYATLPDSAGQGRLTRRMRLAGAKQQQDVFRGLLAVEEPAELSVEALRSLRTSLYFAMLEAGNNRLMIAGAGPGVGKSFVAANLAVVCAQAGQRVLLIDADMRRGRLHHAFHVKGVPGLSELLAQRIERDEAIRASEVEGLDFVTRGTVPPNPSELLMQRSFHDFLQAMSGVYDLVVIDTPPVLAVTDAAVVGKLAGTSLLVVRFGVNPPAEIKAAKRRLESAGVRLKGAILNGLEKPTSNRYGHYGNYIYAYR